MPFLAIFGSRAALYAAIVGLGLMLVMCWVTGSNLRRDLASATNTIDNPKTGLRVQLKAENEARVVCESSNRSLQSSLSTQNAAVARLEQAGKEASRRAQIALADARKASEQASGEAARILNLRPQGEVCDAALQLMRQP